uniref:Uncharacterized protein n=1 Tax=Oryza rufipogon TaxID=4529 RepID=A0A0E0Q6T3_ORYRU
MALSAHGETVAATGAARRQDGAAGEEEREREDGAVWWRCSDVSVAVAAAGDEEATALRSQEHGTKGIDRGRGEDGARLALIGGAAVLWAVRKWRRRGCVGRRRRWIERRKSNRERGLARLGVVKVGAARRCGGVRGSVSARAPGQEGEQDGRAREGKAKGGGGKGALLHTDLGEQREERRRALALCFGRVRTGVGRRGNRAWAATGRHGARARGAAGAAEIKWREREIWRRSDEGGGGKDGGDGERRENERERGERERRRSLSRSEHGNREESRNGFKVDSDIGGIMTSIWRGFKEAIEFQDLISKLVFTPKFGTYGRNRGKLPKFGK